MVKSNYLKILQEGALFKSKIVFYEKTLPGFLKALHKCTMISKKYKLWHAKQSKANPDKWDPPSIELVIYQQSIAGSIVGTVRKKQKSNQEKYKFQLIDGDNAEASLFANSEEAYEIDSFEVLLKT
jgi:hypothetical protein